MGLTFTRLPDGALNNDSFMDKDETAKADEETSEEEKTTEEETSKEDSTSTEEIDYEAELEEEKKRGVPDPERAREAFKKREEKRKQDDDEEDDDEDKPLKRSELQKLLAQERQRAYKQAQTDRIHDIARELADSDSEARYIVEIHKNRTFPDSLSLKEQVEEAYAIANRKRLVAKNTELVRALKARDGVSRNSAGTHRTAMEGTQPKMSAQDTASYTRAGFTYDTKNRVWKKQLPNKKFLIKDPKTKRTWVQ